MSDTRYYLQNVTAGYVGNSPLFWASDNNGYTQWLDEAAKMTSEEALEIIRTTTSHHLIAWPVDQVDARAQRTVDVQKLKGRTTHGQKSRKKTNKAVDRFRKQYRAAFSDQCITPAELDPSALLKPKNNG